MSEQSKAPGKYRWHAASLLLGLLLLSALIITVSHIGDIEHLIQLARQAEPAWIAAGVLLQCGTYLCEALAWQGTLHALGIAISLAKLVPLSVAKLFSDQAMPSGGLSGTAFFLSALRHRGIDTPQALACLLVNLVAHFCAYLAMAFFNLLILARYHAMNRWIVTVTVLLGLVALAVPLAVLGMRWRGIALDVALRRHLPRLAEPLKTLGDAPATLAVLLHQPQVIIRQFGLQCLIIALDMASLWVMLKALGQDVSILVAFSGFMTAAIVATLSPIPLGLGSFEASCVAMLHVLGVGIEASLMATILLRGMTVWLPMLPGLWLIRRELLLHDVNPDEGDGPSKRFPGNSRGHG